MAAMSISDTTFTDNSALTFSTAGDARVDFFFHITENSDKEKTIDLLSKSWNKEPLDTLKLIGFLRDCRNGKGIRRQYQICLLWLFDNHFETLVNNLETLVSFGYWKDVLHLLIILLFDRFIPDYLATDDGSRSKSKRGRKMSGVVTYYDRIVLNAEREMTIKRIQEINNKTKSAKNNRIQDSDELIENEFQYKEMENVVQTVPTPEESLIECRINYNKMRYNSDHKYRRLYDKVVQLFVEQLVTDLSRMSDNNWSISLAAKWAPSSGHHFDKYLDICGPIAKQLCERLDKSFLIEDKRLSVIFYQMKVCAPLRAYLKIPEVYMSANQWSQLEYNRVSSKCMQKNKQLFIKHDSQRFEKFLASKKTISGAVLKPIELLERGDELIRYPRLPRNLQTKTNEELQLEKEVLEKQWLSLAEDIKKRGGCLLSEAIAVCDVSGSMRGDPMAAARALTLLVMSLSSHPWNSLCITFSQSPEFHSVDPNSTFIEKLKSVNYGSMKWGYNTNIDKVFDVILDKAVEQRLTDQQMPKLVFIFTDMEFDSASPNTGLTNFESAKHKFAQRNYKLPSIVFWNLRGDKSKVSQFKGLRIQSKPNGSQNTTPVQINERGVALMSGYSGKQLSLIMKAKDFDHLNPYLLMRSAIDRNQYESLKVFD